MFDEIAFEQERFDLVCDNNDVKISDLVDKCFGLRVQWALAAKVRPDSISQLNGFANVYDLAMFVFHQVDTWLLRELGEFLVDEVQEFSSP